MDLRNRTIIRYEAAGVIMNLLLSVAKFIFGYLINSRAILMDAWNGFSDMVSSVLSILSAAYASKRVDREHPLGFGRLEYVTSMFSTVFIVFMGLRGICGTNLNEVTLRAVYFIKPKDIRELRSHPGHSSRNEGAGVFLRLWADKSYVPMSLLYIEPQ